MVARMVGISVLVGLAADAAATKVSVTPDIRRALLSKKVVKPKALSGGGAGAAVNPGGKAISGGGTAMTADQVRRAAERLKALAEQALRQLQKGKPLTGGGARPLGVKTVPSPTPDIRRKLRQGNPAGSKRAVP